MGATTVTMPQAKKAAELYAAGMSQRAIAEAIGLTRRGVRTALHHMGIECRRNWSAFGREGAQVRWVGPDHAEGATP